MRNNVRVLRRLALLLAVVTLLCLAPGSARANAAHDPYWKTVTLSKATLISKTIAKLTKGKVYYVRVRAFKKVGSKKYYSAWSAAKKVKISK